MTETKSLDELFKDRYTDKDERYKKMAETGFEKVIVVHPWDARRNNFRGRGGGGYNNQNRGGWVPRGGGGGGGRGQYGGYRGGWQDRGGPRQPWRGGDRKREHY
ncbi:hypothetical protein B9Z55_002643 [Caenorhabditis nigoni]|uniref:Uncharacterized protein n=1 Tax=Caenorhabditis nigoni TaxID=1611254 RepID=A0A2G5VLQ4_9PELO|nr:hypothetical protein B9Z55_002643 [Caenorhabditis nigoni]